MTNLLSHRPLGKDQFAISFFSLFHLKNILFLPLFVEALFTIFCFSWLTYPWTTILYTILIKLLKQCLHPSMILVMLSFRTTGGGFGWIIFLMKFRKFFLSLVFFIYYADLANLFLLQGGSWNFWFLCRGCIAELSYCIELRVRLAFRNCLYFCATEAQCINLKFQLFLSIICL